MGKIKRSKVAPAVAAYLSAIGKRGGSVQGSCKARGDAEHYRLMARQRWGPSKANG